MDAIWANTDYPYLCLRDRARTDAFRRAITEVVTPGDHVVEIGAGTGILSLFACSAGAAHVTAVEIVPELATLITATAAANGFADRISVINADARDITLPPADVVIAELIETGLLDEPQLPVMNLLIDRGVITEKTRVIPAAYRTNLQLVTVDETMYGYTIKAMRHEWPFYAHDPRWATVTVQPASDAVTVWQARFADGPHPTTVQRRPTFTVDHAAPVNGLRISGALSLSPTLTVGAFDSLNGDKILPLPARTVQGRVALDVAFEMGGGLGSLHASWSDNT